MIEVFVLALCILALSLNLPIAAQLMLLVFAVILVIPGLFATARGAPFVPTTRPIMDTMIRWAEIRPGETVYDLGCGDGRLVFAAARKGARAIGYELSLPTFVLAKFRSLFHPKSSIRLRNFWSQNYRDADVVFCFLLKNTMQDFRRIVWPQLKPGCRVVSHAFLMENIEPVKRDRNVIMYVK